MITIFIQNRRLIGIAFILFILALAFTVTPVYKLTSLTAGSNKTVLREITKDIYINQKIYSQFNGLNRIEVVMATYDRENTSTIYFQLLDENGYAVAEHTVNAADIVDNAAYNFTFSPLSDSGNKSYYLQIKSDAEEGNGITLYCTTSTGTDQGLDISGVPFDGNLVLTTESSNLQPIFSYGLSPARALLLLVFFYLPFIFFYYRHQVKITKNLRYLLTAYPALMVLFFSIPSIISSDSGHYLNYLPILEGTRSFAEWDIVRGPVFPAVLYFFTKLFGYNLQGILTGQFLFYIFFLLLLSHITNRYVPQKKQTTLFFMIYTFLIVINPLIFGVFHTLLTEFIAIPFGLLSCFLAVKWLDSDKENFRTHIGYILYFVVSSVVLWQTKQTFMACTLYPLAGILLLSLIRRLPWKAIAYRGVTLALCVVFMLLSSLQWTIFIDNFGEMDTSRTTASMANSRILARLPISLLSHGITEAQISSGNISLGDIKHLESRKNQSKYMENSLVYKDNAPGGTNKLKILFTADSKPSFGENVAFAVKYHIEHPLDMLDIYLRCYLKIGNYLNPSTEITNEPGDTICSGHGDENGLVYYRSFYATNAGGNVFPMREDLEIVSKTFSSTTVAPKLIRHGFLFEAITYADASFKLLILTSVPVWFFLFILVFKYRKELPSMPQLSISFVIWTYSVLNIAFHVMLVLPIDRYASLSYAVMVALSSMAPFWREIPAETGFGS